MTENNRQNIKLVMIAFLFSCVLCDTQWGEIIENPNFKPSFWLGPREYADRQITFWYEPILHLLNISTWTHVMNHYFESNTLLVMNFTRHQYYTQQVIIEDPGKYELWARIYNEGLDVGEQFQFRISWCNVSYWTKYIGHTPGPIMAHLITIYAAKPIRCPFVMYQRIILNKKVQQAPIVLYISNLTMIATLDPKINEKSLIDEGLKMVYGFCGDLCSSKRVVDSPVQNV